MRVHTEGQSRQACVAADVDGPDAVIDEEVLFSGQYGSFDAVAERQVLTLLIGPQCGGQIIAYVSKQEAYSILMSMLLISGSYTFCSRL